MRIRFGFFGQIAIVVLLVTWLQLTTHCIEHKSTVPLHFRDAIVQINNYVLLSKTYLNISSQPNISLDRALSVMLNGQNNVTSEHRYDDISLLTRFLDVRPYDLNAFVADALTSLKSNAHLNAITTDCRLQLEQLVSSFKNRTNWSFRVFDSYGKPPSGILNGNLDWYGEFSECRNISALNSTWNGKYALISKPIDPEDMFRPYTSKNIRYGICVPDKCTSEDVATVINNIIDRIWLNNTQKFQINSTWIQIQETKTVDDFGQGVINFLNILLIIIGIGTAYDFYKRYKHYLQCQEILSESTTELNKDKDEIMESEHLYFLNLSHDPIILQVLASFSIYTNARRILRTSTSYSQMKCLHGIRFLSMCWVILGHSFVFNLGYSDNLIVVGDYLKKFSFLIISNAFYSVDTFFLLSGLLTSYSFLREYDRLPSNNRFSLKFIVKYFLHRIWRISPSYFILILINASLSPYYGTGPMYPADGFEPNKCSSTWWTNLLYINNLVDTRNMCFGISWYLANDMQFHFISPFILIFFAKNKKNIGIFLCFLLLLGNIVASSIILVLNDGLEFAQFSPKFTDYFHKFYILPWCRIGPYVVGLLLGYLLVLYKKRKYVFKPSSLFNTIGWTISISLCSLVVFGLYPDVRVDGHPLSKPTHIVYQSCSRIVWACSLAYIIYSCITLNGGLVNRILSLSYFVPLSKLTYCAYLVHTIVIIYFNTTQEHPLHIQNASMVYYFIANLVVSYSCAFFISILFELPFIGIEKYVFRRSASSY